MCLWHSRLFSSRVDCVFIGLGFAVSRPRGVYHRADRARAREVARWLQNHPQTSLASLELRGADITAAGAQAIADVVWPRPPPHLIDLDLRGNIISRGVSVGDHMGALPPPIQWDGPAGQYYQ